MSAFRPESYAERLATFKPLKRSRMKLRGPKVKAWNSARAKLKPKFEAVGITTCEIRYAGCWQDDYLGFAHDAKRRKQPNLTKVALACNFCHDILENLGPERMKAEVERIIARRPVQP